MTRLSYLHEPGVLWNIKCRYTYDDIYTYTGSILIAVNPFAPLPHLYGPHMMDQYRGADLGDLSPHVYAIADAAYRQMRKEMKGQSILVGWGAVGTAAAASTAAAWQVLFSIDVADQRHMPSQQACRQHGLDAAADIAERQRQLHMQGAFLLFDLWQHFHLPPAENSNMLFRQHRLGLNKDYCAAYPA